MFLGEKESRSEGSGIFVGKIESSWIKRPNGEGKTETGEYERPSSHSLKDPGLADGYAHLRLPQ